MATIRSLESKLAAMDIKAKVGGWLKFFREERLKVILDIWKCLRRKEQKLRQKAKIK